MSMKRSIPGMLFAGCLMALAFAPVALAGTAEAPLYRISNNGQEEQIGMVFFTDTPSGTKIKVDVSGLPPGPHGFHIHEGNSCAAGEKDGQMIPGLKAGGHYDPGKTGVHAGPDGKGHAGDLPVLTADPSGKVLAELMSANFTTEEVDGHPVVIHSGGDNYSDAPKPMGGGGERIACGIIRKK